MNVLGIDFNDAALTGFAGTELRFSEPGYALCPDGQLLFGHSALQLARRYPRLVNNRFWTLLSEEPLPSPLGEASSPADLAQLQLAQLWRQHGGDCEAAVFAVPAAWDSQQLGLLLGIAQDEGIPVRGFVNAAVAATRREYPGHALIAIEARLHGVDVTVMGQNGRVELAESHAVAGVGVELLERAAARYCAACFLSQSRFDPLHDAESEQALYDRLPGWLEEISRRPEIEAVLESAEGPCRVRLERAALATEITTACQPLLQALRPLLSAGRATALQLGARLAAFPGVVQHLSEQPDVAVFVLEPGAAARGARRAATRAGGGDVRLMTRLAWDQPPAPEAAVAGEASSRGAPTHLLAGSQAFRLGPRALSIGTEVTPGDYGLALDPGLAGVSRRHCSVQQENGRVVLTDHSRYGTWLNGHAISGSVVLQAGDVIAIGQPPVELRLAAEVEPDGA